MSRCEDYLRDVLTTLLEDALEAKADYSAKSTQVGDEEAQFEAGRALGYYEAMSLLIGELDKFGIPRESIGLDPTLDIDAHLL